MSFFGTSWEDPKTAAIMGLAGGLLQGNAGAGLQQGLLGYQRQAQINNQNQRLSAADAREAEQFGIQKQQWQAQADAAKAKQFNEQRVRELLPKVATGELDAASAIAGGVPADLVKAIKEAGNLGRSKVARTAEVMGPNGQKQIVQLDEFGQPVGEGMAGYVAPQLVNLGDRQVFTTPQAGAAFNVGMSPADRQRIAQGWASQNIAQQRLAFDMQGGAEGMKPKLVDGQWVTPPTGMRPGETRPATMPTAVKEANEALALIRQAEEIIPRSTGSYAGAAVDQAGRLFGVSTGGDKAAAQLKALEGALVSKMPKMSGPQSDKDVLLYKQMAGEIGDPTIPNDRKMAALEVIKEIHQRNAGPRPPMPQPGTMGSGSFGMQPSGGWSIRPLP
jgi:anti-sigma28 factor (negative regulator of flagellin synthesis)